MKKIIVIIVSGLCIANGHAQTGSEWFSQKKTQIKYLTRQIAALQIYIGYVQKGYSIAKEGLHLIGDIKKGDFNLHSDYFNSLKNVNPKISRYVKITDIISCEVNMLKTYRNAYRRIRESGRFTAKEISYMYSVFTKVRDDAADIIDELMTLITGSGYEMKDDERLQRIEELYSDIQDKQTFVQHFSSAAITLSIQSAKEMQEVEVSRSLNSKN